MLLVVRRVPPTPRKLRPMRNGVRNIISSPARMLVVSVLLLFIAGLCGPALVARLAADGGFLRYGWNSDLSRWNRITVNRGDQPLLHTDLLTSENGIKHKEMWINTGQSITFQGVTATEATQFVSLARVHPAWNAGAALGALMFRATVRAGGADAVVEVRVEGPREQAGEWQRLVVDLSRFAGEEVDIEIKPVSRSVGTWTLWRDPAIAVRP